MSYHIYVAKDGFKNNPISEQEFLDVTKRCEELEVMFVKNRRRPFHKVSLKNDRRSRLGLTPYGLIHAQHPSLDLVKAMFHISSLLGGGVYSEDLHQYKSIEDWDKNTKEFRRNLDAKRHVNKVKRRIRLALLALLIVGSSLAGYFWH